MKGQRPIRVLFVTGALAFGGLERVIVNLCRNLDKNHFNVSVVCIKSRGAIAGELEEEGIRVISLEANRRRILKYVSWIRLAKIVRAEQVDIIHSHNTAAFLDGMLAFGLSHCSAIIHTDHTRKFPDKRHYMIAERFASMFAYRIVAVSEETKQNLIQYENIEGRKIIVINNGIEKDKYDIMIDIFSYRKKLGLERFDFIVGLGVVLREQKGIQYLIEAAPMVLAKYPKTGFLIAGDGPERSKLEEMVSANGLSRSFVFLGSRQDIPQILQAIDVFVLPSIYEGLPLCILEAMAARRCILATNVGGVPLAIRNGLEGILVPSQNSDRLSAALLKLREDPNMRKRLSNLAYQRFLEHFTAQSMTRRYEQLYFEALQ